MKNYIISRRFGWIIVLLLSLLPLLNLVHPGLPVTHDGQDHVARIANFYQSFTEGNFVPRWAANLNWGYGHPILMFLYPLPSYIAIFFHYIGFSFVDSTKLVFAVSFVASVMTMYLWASDAWGTVPAVVASVLYGFAPYRFVDLYVRGAIGEHMAFVFLPLILWGIVRLKNNSHSMAASAAMTFGTAALILSHNAISIMFLPIAVLYAVYVAYDKKGIRWSFMIRTAVYITFGFIMSAFFWAPAFFEGKYTLRDIVTAGQFDGRYVSWMSFIYSPWSYGGSDLLSKSLGFAQLGTVIVAISIFRKSGRDKLFLLSTLVLLLLSLLVMTSAAKLIWQHVSLIQKFQFPWRFLSVSVFALAVLGGITSSILKNRQTVFAVVICALSLVGTFTMWHAHAYKVYPASFFTKVYSGTTDTGESSPIWSVRFMEHEASASASVIEGQAVIRQVSRTTTKHEYEVHAVSDARILENTLYFPGWNVTVDGKPVSLEFQDPRYRGLMTFMIPTGSHIVIASFTDTKLRRVSNLVSEAGFVLFVIILGTMALWWKKERTYR